MYWVFKQETELTIAVVDKTVPKKDYREHNGLFLLLENKKIMKKNGELYDIGQDYYGYDPYDQKEFPPYNEKGPLDIIYIADTYGVYSDDLENRPKGERSKLIYGGMDLLEWNQIMESKGEETTLIAEFNSFASPTEGIARDIMQRNLFVKWDGWIGRYFADLADEEVPPWLIRNYEEQTIEKWAFNGEGLAFVHTSDKVVVLDKESFEGNVRFEMTDVGNQRFPKVASSNYMYWFDIVQPTDGGEVLANYHLQLTDKGQVQLDNEKLPSSFPAVIHHPEEKTYYFAGDYADYPKRALMKWEGLHHLFKIVANDESQFYWLSYFPMMGSIIDEISEQRKR